MSINPVLVLACHVGGLAVVRALGMNQIPTRALVYEDTDFGDVSKYVSDRVFIPHPRLEEDKFVDFMINNGPEWKDSLIIETDDNCAVALSKNKKTLSEYYKIATAEWDLMKQFLDKEEAHKLAKKARVPHPLNFLPKTIEELEKIKKQVVYPSILKPSKGHEFFSLFNVKNFEVSNEQELFQKFELCLENKQDVMVQEIIVGPETNLYKMQAYVNSKGKVAAKFFWNKIRQHPPMFGVGRVGVSSERNEAVEQLSEQLLSVSRYKGYCSFEFKHDLKDDKLKLMEVNIRMPRNGALAIGSGVNFPYIIYKDLVEDEQIYINDYNKKFYWIEIGLDIYNAVFNHKKENFTLKEYLEPYLSKHKAFAVFSFRDIKPFFKQFLILFLNIFK